MCVRLCVRERVRVNVCVRERVCVCYIRPGLEPAGLMAMPVTLKNPS